MGYQLIHAIIQIDGRDIETYINKSANFRKFNERKISFDTYYDLHREQNESPLDFAIRMGWEEYIYQMMVIDYLICNRDRHGANIELLIDEKDNVRPAPLFDHGVSFLFSCYDNQNSIQKFDVMEDRAVNNYIGSKSLEYNLRLLPKDKIIFRRELCEGDKEKLLKDLEGILSSEHLSKIWAMIWERWNRYVQICNKKWSI